MNLVYIYPGKEDRKPDTIEVKFTWRNTGDADQPKEYGFAVRGC